MYDWGSTLRNIPWTCLVYFNCSHTILKSHAGIHLQLKLWTGAGSFLVSFHIQLVQVQSLHVPQCKQMKRQISGITSQICKIIFVCMPLLLPTHVMKRLGETIYSDYFSHQQKAATLSWNVNQCLLAMIHTRPYHFISLHGEQSCCRNSLTKFAQKLNRKNRDDIYKL